MKTPRKPHEIPMNDLYYRQFNLKPNQKTALKLINTALKPLISSSQYADLHY